MAQNRPPPCYLEYSASMLANFQFRQMPLAARGLLYTLRLECWENHRLPADSKKLASVLRFDETEIVAAMQWLDAFFRVGDGWLTSPDLEDYRKHLADQRRAQSIGGKKGAAKTNAGKSQVARESVVKLNTVQPSTAQSNSVINDREYIDKSWDEFRNESDD
jgi:uncharacterized protein YdaU (DUF1376 family)